MSTLDRIIELQKRGASDVEISTQLQHEGVSPTEINNSLNQARIKNAISAPEESEDGQMYSQGMTSSIMSGQPGQVAAQQPTATIPAPEQYSQELDPNANYQQPAAGAQSQDDYYQQTPQAYTQQD